MRSLLSKRIFGQSTLFLVVLMSAGALSAQTAKSKATVYTGLTGADLQYVLQDAGYRAELTQDGVGDPLVITAMNGVDVNIFFYNCDQEATCGNIRFSVGLDLPDGTTLELANEYNSSRIFGTVNLDEDNDPWLQLTHNVAHGVTAENIEYVLGVYSDALVFFMDHFNFTPA